MNRIRLGVVVLLAGAVAASLSVQSCSSGKVEATPAAAWTRSLAVATSSPS
jgi:hypothetical protein